MINNEPRGYVSQHSMPNIMYRVFGWMTIALSITAITAFFAVRSETFLRLVFGNPLVWAFLLLVQIGLVIGISAGIRRMDLSTALTLFFSYSFLTGLTVSSIFLVYTHSSIALAFFVTAGMFAVMSIYGYITKADLTAMGSFLVMGLFGLILAIIINIFLKSSQFDLLISIAGVFLFTLLTAFDVQRIKNISQSLVADQETVGKIALLGALTLYLDFINLFLYLLRLMGQRRD